MKVKAMYTNEFRRAVMSYADSADVVKASKTHNVPAATIWGWLARRKEIEEGTVLERVAQSAHTKGPYTRKPKTVSPELPRASAQQRATNAEAKEVLSRLLALAERIYA